MNALPHETDVETRLRLAVQRAVGEERYDMWLAESHWESSPQELRILVRDPFRREYLQSRLRAEIETAVRAEIATESSWGVSIVLSEVPKAAAKGTHVPVAAEPPPLEKPAPAKDEHPERRGSSDRPRRRFARLDELVPGSCNQVGVASARMVLDQPGKLTPLFVYGPTGVGKTHLVQGLWCEFQRQSGRGRHIYLTSEQFTSYFLEALHGRGIPNFRRRYRELDLLIVEDVQFFANKRATLDELQYTMDAVSRDGGQVVLTSDRSPAELEQFGGDLVNRFAGGLVARMAPLDPATRLGIVERLVAARSLRVPREVMETIAEQLTDDARKLIGAVNRLHAYSLATKKEIDVSLMRMAMEDIFLGGTKVVQLPDIERAVCHAFGIVAKELRSANRARGASQPRMVAMWLARKHTRSALSEIGEFFGRKSHSTVLAAEKRVADWVGTKQRIRVQDRDCQVDEAIRTIERKLRVS
jgi:chromosomal replication initiator protein